MIIRHKSIDAPDAAGRAPQKGEQQWTLSFPLENGDDYLEVIVGRKSRDAFLRMLAQEDADDLAEGKAK